MKKLKCIITGNRNFYDYSVVEKAIQTSGFVNDIKEIVSLGEYGVSNLGEKYGDQHNIPIKIFKAEWDDITAEGALIRENKSGNKYNAKAGFWRNERASAYADCAIAVVKDEDKMTENIIQLMKKLGKPVYIWEV